MNVFGIEWVGVNADNGRKLLLSISFIAVVLIVSGAIRWAIRNGRFRERPRLR